jgi:membrane protease YdiL (CAAX protease family)
VKIKLINREALDYQLSVEHPPFWQIFRITIGLTFLLEAAGICLIIFSKLPTGNAYQIFRVVWLAGIYVLWTFMAFGLKGEFPDTLKVPPASVPKNWITDLIVVFFAVCLLANYENKMWKVFHYLFKAMSNSKTHHDFLMINKTIIDIHNVAWQSLHFGTDLLGIVLASVAVLLAPVFEELFFRGYMMNSLCERFHPFTAICVSSFWFSVCHIFSKTLEQLPMIFLIGFCCGLIRLRTGRWQDAVKLHFIYNFGILGPKIVIAFLRFHLSD